MKKGCGSRLIINLNKKFMENSKIKKMCLANIENQLSQYEMENIMAGSGRWNCAAGIAGGFLAGMASATGNGVAFALGPVEVTWGFIGGVGGALLGGSAAC